MTRFRWLLGNLLAGCLDFAVGALLVVLLALWLGKLMAWWYLPLGAFLAVLPDMDIVWPILSGRGQTSDHHQTGMHRPILLLPFATVLAFLLGGAFWALATFVSVFWHFLHDTKQLGGGGIAWFWPLSKKYWSFSGAEEPRPVPNHAQWIKEKWLRPSALSVRELSIAVVALLLALLLLIQ